MSSEPTQPSFTYHEAADAVYLYLAGPIEAGELARSQLVLAGRGASVIIGLDHYGQPRGIEFLGITKLLTTEAIELLREGRTPFQDYS